MSEESLREPEEIRQGCIRKMRSIEVGDQLAAVLGFLLGEPWGDPRIEDLQIWAHCLLVRNVGERDYTFIFGIAPELTEKIHKVAAAAGLDGDEMGYVLGRVAAKTGVF